MLKISESLYKKHSQDMRQAASPH